MYVNFSHYRVRRWTILKQAIVEDSTNKFLSTSLDLQGELEMVKSNKLVTCSVCVVSYVCDAMMLMIMMVVV